MRFGVILPALLGISFSAQAFCPFSPNLLNALSEDSVVALYRTCAEGMNDDFSQAYLANVYDRGTTTIPKDTKKALYYYQLSADNGNAESQARLTQLYMELDKDRSGRSDLYSYVNTVIPLPSAEDDFKGELMHPYILLMLSNEKPENKWYYPTAVKKAPAYAVTLFNNYQIDGEKKKQLAAYASAWKKRKLLEIARQILSQNEYTNFVNTLYPANGKADEFKRNQLLKQFREKVNLKQQQDQEGAKAFY